MPSRRSEIYASESTHNVPLSKLPVPVAKKVLESKRKSMEKRHEEQRKEIADEIKRLEYKMTSSSAFTNDIRQRLATIRKQLKKSPKTKRSKSVRFAANVKKDSKHNVLK